MPLVARFADVWNAQIISPDQVRDRSVVLNDLLEAAGRRPEDVRRTLNVPVLCWRTPGELQTRLRSLQRYPEWRDLSAEQMVETLPGLVGTPEEVVTQIRAYGSAGIDEISMQWTAADDIEGLEALAVEVLQPLALTTS